MTRRSVGFTLIELLVVVAIGAILAGLAVLSLGGWQSDDDPERQLARLAALLQVQCEQALFQSRPRGIRLTADGFDFWQAGSAGWGKVPGDGVSRARAWAGDPELVLFVDGRRQLLDEQGDRPQIVCQPLGEITPFELELRRPGSRARLSVSAGRQVNLEVG